MDMEVDPPAKPSDLQIKDTDLFKAAETGDSTTFKSLPQDQLFKSLALRNDDRRSLFHVAGFSPRPEVVKLPSEVADESVVNSADEEAWAPIHSAESIGNVDIIEILLSKGEYIPIPYQKSTPFSFFF